MFFERFGLNPALVLFLGLVLGLLSWGIDNCLASDFEADFDSPNTTLHVSTLEPLGQIEGASVVARGSSFGIFDGSFGFNPACDFDGDGVISPQDVSLIRQAFGTQEGDPNYSRTLDPDRNGIVDIVDTLAVRLALGKELGETYIEFEDGTLAKILSWIDNEIEFLVPFDLASRRFRVVTPDGLSNLVSLDEPIVDGAWCGFDQWTECSAPCGGGTQERTQIDCLCPAPSNGGLNCSSPITETRRCNEFACPIPVDGGWCGYGQWSECSAPCGGGIQTRREEFCNCPSPSGDGSFCATPSIETRACNQMACPVTPICGDRICSNGENSSSCPEDCKEQRSPKEHAIAALIEFAGVTPTFSHLYELSQIEIDAVRQALTNLTGTKFIIASGNVIELARYSPDGNLIEQLATLQPRQSPQNAWVVVEDTANQIVAELMHFDEQQLRTPTNCSLFDDPFKIALCRISNWERENPTRSGNQDSAFIGEIEQYLIEQIPDFSNRFLFESTARYLDVQPLQGNDEIGLFYSYANGQYDIDVVSLRFENFANEINSNGPAEFFLVTEEYLEPFNFLVIERILQQQETVARNLTSSVPSCEAHCNYTNQSDEYPIPCNNMVSAFFFPLWPMNMPPVRLYDYSHEKIALRKLENLGYSVEVYSSGVNVTNDLSGSLLESYLNSPAQIYYTSAHGGANGEKNPLHIFKDVPPDALVGDYTRQLEAEVRALIQNSCTELREDFELPIRFRLVPVGISPPEFGLALSLNFRSLVFKNKAADISFSCYGQANSIEQSLASVARRSDSVNWADSDIGPEFYSTVTGMKIGTTQGSYARYSKLGDGYLKYPLDQPFRTARNVHIRNHNRSLFGACLVVPGDFVESDGFSPREECFAIPETFDPVHKRKCYEEIQGSVVKIPCYEDARDPRGVHLYPYVSYVTIGNGPNDDQQHWQVNFSNRVKNAHFEFLDEFGDNKLDGVVPDQATELDGSFRDFQLLMPHEIRLLSWVEWRDMSQEERENTHIGQLQVSQARALANDVLMVGNSLAEQTTHCDYQDFCYWHREEFFFWDPNFPFYNARYSESFSSDRSINTYEGGQNIYKASVPYTYRRLGVTSIGNDGSQTSITFNRNIFDPNNPTTDPGAASGFVSIDYGKCALWEEGKPFHDESGRPRFGENTIDFTLRHGQHGGGINLVYDWSNPAWLDQVVRDYGPEFTPQTWPEDYRVKVTVSRHLRSLDTGLKLRGNETVSPNKWILDSNGDSIRDAWSSNRSENGDFEAWIPCLPPPEVCIIEKHALGKHVDAEVVNLPPGACDALNGRTTQTRALYFPGGEWDLENCTEIGGDFAVTTSTRRFPDNDFVALKGDFYGEPFRGGIIAGPATLHGGVKRTYRYTTRTPTFYSEGYDAEIISGGNDAWVSSHDKGIGLTENYHAAFKNLYSPYLIDLGLGDNFAPDIEECNWISTGVSGWYGDTVLEMSFDRRVYSVLNYLNFSYVEEQEQAGSCAPDEYTGFLATSHFCDYTPGRRICPIVDEVCCRVNEQFDSATHSCTPLLNMEYRQ